MTRKEQIHEKSLEINNPSWREGFREGAEWADDNPIGQISFRQDFETIALLRQKCDKMATLIKLALPLQEYYDQSYKYLDEALKVYKDE